MLTRQNVIVICCAQFSRIDTNVCPRSIGRNVAVRELIVSSPFNNHAQTYAIQMALTLGC